MGEERKLSGFFYTCGDLAMPALAPALPYKLFNRYGNDRLENTGDRLRAIGERFGSCGPCYGKRIIGPGPAGLL